LNQRTRISLASVRGVATPQAVSERLQARQRIERTRLETRAAIDAAEAEFRKAIQDAREAGYSLEKIGAALGITRQRVAQLLED